jgi:nicotinamide-nucleotide amidase
MHIEVISIGTELLTGKTINSNLCFIGDILKKNGFIINKAFEISDDQKEMKNQILESFKRSNLTIVTGGLGPTIDDNTKKTASQIFETPLEFNSEVYSYLSKNFKDLSSIKEQSTYPKNSYLLKNEIGTAFGFIIKKEKHQVMFLPGVPLELENMFENFAIDYINKHFTIEKKFFQKKINIILKEEVEVNEFLKSLSTNIDIGIYPNFENITITLSVYAKNKKIADEKIDPIKKLIEDKFKTYTFLEDKIEKEIHNLFLEKKYLLTFAESCSGGSLSSKITALPGSSKYFLGSFITYSNELKKSVLKVSEKTLKDHGAVSIQAVKEMFKGSLNAAKANFSIAISGIAGPGGASMDKPIGTVCIAVGTEDKFFSNTFHFHGNREVIIKRAIITSLSILYRMVKYNIYEL